MTFLNVINFGDQGECGDVVERRHRFVAASENTENIRNHLKITRKRGRNSKALGL